MIALARSLARTLTHSLTHSTPARPLITANPTPEDNRTPNPSLFGSLRAHTIQPGAQRVSAARAPYRALPLKAVWDQGSLLLRPKGPHAAVTLHAYDRSGTAVQTKKPDESAKILNKTRPKARRPNVFFFFF